VPLEEATRALALDEDFLSALLHHRGAAGETLRQTLAYEQGRWDRIEEGPSSRDKLAAAYLEAVAWADQTCRELLFPG